jgi:hypothetical protein
MLSYRSRRYVQNIVLGMAPIVMLGRGRADLATRERIDLPRCQLSRAQRCRRWWFFRSHAP